MKLNEFLEKTFHGSRKSNTNKALNVRYHIASIKNSIAEYPFKKAATAIAIASTLGVVHYNSVSINKHDSINAIDKSSSVYMQRDNVPVSIDFTDKYFFTAGEHSTSQSTTRNGDLIDCKIEIDKSGWSSPDKHDHTKFSLPSETASFLIAHEQAHCVDVHLSNTNATDTTASYKTVDKNLKSESLKSSMHESFADVSAYLLLASKYPERADDIHSDIMNLREKSYKESVNLVENNSPELNAPVIGKVIDDHYTVDALKDAKRVFEGSKDYLTSLIKTDQYNAEKIIYETAQKIALKQTLSITKEYDKNAGNSVKQNNLHLLEKYQVPNIINNIQSNQLTTEQNLSIKHHNAVSNIGNNKNDLIEGDFSTQYKALGTDIDTIAYLRGIVVESTSSFSQTVESLNNFDKEAINEKFLDKFTHTQDTHHQESYELDEVSDLSL